MAATDATQLRAENRSAKRQSPGIPEAGERQNIRVQQYDPLESRFRLNEALWEEFRVWSAHARSLEKPDPYVAKVLQMLNDSLCKCDDLLDKLHLLATTQGSAEVKVDLTLIRKGIDNTDRLTRFVEKMRAKLEDSAVPVDTGNTLNEAELLSQGDQPEAGSPIDVELFERRESE